MSVPCASFFCDSVKYWLASVDGMHAHEGLCPFESPCFRQWCTAFRLTSAGALVISDSLLGVTGYPDVRLLSCSLLRRQ